MKTPSRPSRETPTRADVAARAPESRFTEEELALILNRAAELQEGSTRPGGARYTLAEIQEIAAGAGIAPSHVAAVAAGLRESGARGRHLFLGAPSRFRFEETIEGEVADDVVGEMIDLARRELGTQGQIHAALGAVHWAGRDSLGGTDVTVTRRGGRTTIGILSARTDAAALAGTFWFIGAFFGTIVLTGGLVAAAGVAGPIAGVAAVAGAGGGSWLSLRTLWRRFALRHSERIATLSESLTAIARRAVEEGRVADGPATETSRAPGSA